MTNEEKYKTPEERIDAFNAFCEQYNKCKDCRLFTTTGSGARSGCALKWLTIEAEEDKLLPCPFCGGKASAIWILNHSNKAVRCGSCRATSGMHNTRAEATAAWNRRAK